MVWKILSVISALCLGASVYFAITSKDDIKVERQAKEDATKNLALAKSKKKEADERLTAKKTQLATLTKDLEKLKTDVAQAVAEVQEKSTALELAKKNLEETTKQLTAIQQQIKDMGDVEKLLARVADLKKEREAAEAKVATETQAIAAASEKLTALQSKIETSREAEARARKGEMEPNFTARIAQPFGDWGFAVISKGNSGGVVANADLNVKRGDTIVAKLKVRNVEQSISIADIVPGSLAAGEVLRSGDLVVAAPTVKKEPAPPPAEYKAPGAKPPVTAPSDPFGAPAAAPAAPAAADPFGAAPAATTPPAGVAPAPPAAADPFVTPPAAVPPAGAPPAAGAGTKESPSTADPFAK